jgi:hypothetical protein
MTASAGLFAWQCTPQIGRTLTDFLETVTYRQGRFYRQGRVITGPPGPEMLLDTARCNRCMPNSTINVSKRRPESMNEHYRVSSTYYPMRYPEPSVTAADW